MFRTAVLAVALALAATVTCAQDYPARPIQMLVPFPPGGIVDIMARGFAQPLDGRLGQRVLVVNRPGGGLTIGMVGLAQAPADGYTVLYSPVTPITIQPHRMKNLAYTRETIIPICQTFENVFYVAVGPKSQFQDFQSLVAYAKANPGKLRYVTPGVASSPHLAGAELWRSGRRPHRCPTREASASRTCSPGRSTRGSSPPRASLRRSCGRSRCSRPSR
jgi:tripartite-type tricarboxylate transporter receptor subunit TctC